MDLRLNPDGPHSDELTREAAAALAEIVRYLNHATRDRDAMADAATVYAVLGDLHATLSGLDQLLRQAGERLSDMDMFDDRHPHLPDVATRTVAEVRGHLRLTRQGLRGPVAQIGVAHAVASHLGMHDEGGPADV